MRRLWNRVRCSPISHLKDLTVQEQEVIVSELRREAAYMRVFYLSWKLHCADSPTDTQ